MASSEFPQRLNKEQRAAKAAFADLLKDMVEADRRYDLIPGTQNGNLISTDLARFLEVRYRDSLPRDLAPGWDLAWRYAHDRLERELKSRKRRKIVGFMAGGWGAGKTHTLEKAAVAGFALAMDLAWDGTLADSNWARKMIDLSLSLGWKVQIAYVYRNIELALYGAVERAKKEGRPVPLVDLPGNHRAVQVSIGRLLRLYAKEEQVSFALVHNIGSATVRGDALQIEHAELAPKGALHYSQRYEGYYAKAACEIEALNPLEF